MRTVPSVHTYMSSNMNIHVMYYCRLPRDFARGLFGIFTTFAPLALLVVEPCFSAGFFFSVGETGGVTLLSFSSSLCLE